MSLLRLSTSPTYVPATGRTTVRRMWGARTSDDHSGLMSAPPCRLLGKKNRRRTMTPPDDSRRLDQGASAADTLFLEIFQGAGVERDRGTALHLVVERE